VEVVGKTGESWSDRGREFVGVRFEFVCGHCDQVKGWSITLNDESLSMLIVTS